MTSTETMEGGTALVADSGTASGSDQAWTLGMSTPALYRAECEQQVGDSLAPEVEDAGLDLDGHEQRARNSRGEHLTVEVRVQQVILRIIPSTSKGLR